MKQFLLFFCILVTTLTAEESSSCANVMFAPPKGWQMAETAGLPSRIKLMVVGKGKHTFPPSLNLATENYGEGLEQYLQIVKMINETKSADWKELGNIETKAGPAHLSQVDAEEEWGEVRYLHAMIEKEGTIYILTAAALKEEFTKFYPEFFASLQSLEIVIDE